MESGSQDRNLPATQRKLEQARREGQVARSRDLSHLAVLGTGAVVLLLLLPAAFGRLRVALAQALAFDARTIGEPQEMLARLTGLSGMGLLGCIVFGGLVLVASVVSTVAAGGWIVSTKPITPDLKRLSPLSGLRNLLSRQQMTNVAKLLLLSTILAAVAWVFLRGHTQEIAALMLQPSPAALRALGEWFVLGTGLLLLVVLAAAVVDVPLQGYFHRARLRMSHQELKQELKESDGNPHLKGRQRSAAREIAQRASITAVPRADFVLMNPTHYAVALRYDDKAMSAPQVVSKGADLLAMRIRDVANDHAVPVVQSPMLARALYAHAEIDQPIPAALFAAVAQVLAYVYRLKAAMRGQGPMPLTVPVPEVPAELDPHQNPVRRKNRRAP